ncbi:MAG: nitroreductase family protein [Betaproteobacteria bacterium]|nr:nitroreductase family protein [Betaproteobacteria bacterium]
MGKEIKNLVIIGETSDGKTFRPSDWAERLCSLTSAVGNNKKVKYSQFVRPGCTAAGIKTVIVNPHLHRADPLAWKFVLDFAKDHDLQIETIPVPPAYAAVDEIFHARHSVRRFLPTPVSRDVVAELLELASRSPSGTNAQPWKVYALAGAAREALSAALLERFDQEASEEREYDYYPDQWAEPWLSRRRKLGFDLYALVSIPKGNKSRMKEQTGRNYLFFDAPVGLIFTLDRRLTKGMFLDYGIFIGHLIIAAQARGLASCMQTTFVDYPDTVRRHLGIGEQEMIVGGLALGHADPEAPENGIVTEREPVETFTSFRGF